MARRSVIVCGCIVILVLSMMIWPPPPSVEAGGDVPPWMYSVEMDGEGYTVLRTDLDTGQTVPIATIPRVGTVPLNEIVSPGEIEAAREYFDEFGDWYTLGGRFPPMDEDRFLSGMPDVILRVASPSPDNELVALALRYENCARPPGTGCHCFGATEVILLSGRTGAQTKIWSIDYSSTDFFSESAWVRETYIDDIQWIAGQRAVAVEISFDGIRRNAANRSVVVIPFLDERPAFRIGDGYFWGASRTEYKIATIQRVPNSPELLATITFNPITRETSEITYSLDTYRASPHIG
ncbi:MAG: hypothetical protein GYB65_21570, partial [Chloroflexi bacterium]|nr:hypothetical protein [Chloroflexota bacterium]